MRDQSGLKRMVFGMEPTGDYHKPLGEHLLRCGHEVVLVSGVAASENRKTLDGRWDTNDIHHDPQRDRLIDRVRALMPFVDAFITAAGERDSAVRQVPLPFELSASLTASHAMMLRPKTASNVYVLPDSTSSLTRAADAGQRAARKLA